MPGRGTEIKGAVKQTAGKVLGNEQMEAEGQADRRVGKAARETKGAANKVAGGVKKVAGKAVGNEQMQAEGEARTLKGKVQFAADELMIRVNDRLRAPNTAETWKALEPEARSVLQGLLGADIGIEPAPPSEELFTLKVRSKQPATIQQLLSRLPS